MALQRKNFRNPDETKTPPNARIDTITMGDMAVIKQSYQPGWDWLKDSKPSAGTNSCQMHHFGVMESGRMLVISDDGKQMEIGPGDVADIPPGHVGRVIGNEPAVFYWFTGKNK